MAVPKRATGKGTTEGDGTKIILPPSTAPRPVLNGLSLNSSGWKMSSQLLIESISSVHLQLYALTR